MTFAKIVTVMMYISIVLFVVLLIANKMLDAKIAAKHKHKD